MRNILKLCVLAFLTVSNIQAQMTQGKIADGPFANKIFEGNVVNSELLGETKIFCSKNDSTINYYVNYVNGFPDSGTVYSCDNERLSNEIEYGIYSKANVKPEYDFSLKGKFNSKAKNKNDLLTDGMEAIVKFYNTNSYDILKGKYYRIDGKDYVKGTLYLKNNIIKEITATFDLKRMKFYKNEIEIKTNKITITGYITDSGDDINKFKFDGAIIWNASGCKEIKSGTFVEESLLAFENKECSNSNKSTNKTNSSVNKEATQIVEKNEISIKKQDINIKTEKDIKLEKVETKKDEIVNMEK